MRSRWEDWLEIVLALFSSDLLSRGRQSESVKDTFDQPVNNNEFYEEGARTKSEHAVSGSVETSSKS